MTNYTNNLTKICTKKTFPDDVYILSYAAALFRFLWNKCCQIVNHMEFFFPLYGWDTKPLLFLISLPHKNSPSQIFGIRCSYDLVSITFSFSSFTSIPAHPHLPIKSSNPKRFPIFIFYFSYANPFSNQSVVTMVF